MIIKECLKIKNKMDLLDFTCNDCFCQFESVRQMMKPKVPLKYKKIW